MRKIIALFTLLVLLASCQKEISFENSTTNNGGGSSGGSTNGNRLVKITMKAGSDTGSVRYTYNSANKLIGYAGTQEAAQYSGDLVMTIKRNSSNIITEITEVGPELQQSGIDKITHYYYYDDVNKRYKSEVTKYSVQGMEMADSNAFGYSSGNKLESSIEYSDYGTGYEVHGKYVFTFTGNNITKEEFLTDFGTGNLKTQMTTTYEYDSKTNPLQYADEAVPLTTLEDYATFMSVNNITKRSTVIANVPLPQTQSFTYTYNSTNRPSTATINYMGVSGSAKYFYE